ncbi:amidase signature enzyme [Neoconidiobolus thromboides FSU 785]|nr:amidase signature enzyme [Neoconidiobolus thromboides FSU 785]
MTLINLENTPIQEIANNVRQGTWKAVDVLSYFIETSQQAHSKTNCITQRLDEYALNLAKDLDEKISSGIEFNESDYPLLGIPVSVKDMIDIKGYPSIAGLKCNLNKKAVKDGSMIELVKSLGAIPFCKTNMCQLALTTESTNPVNGRTFHPISKKYSAGGSSSGEGPLIKLGGSVFGIGTDVGGSLRYPATWTGIYCFKPTSGYLPTKGSFKFQSGQGYVKPTPGPMTNSMENLSLLVETLLMAKNRQKVDPSCIPISKGDEDIINDKKVRFGYYSSYGKLPTTPAVERGVLETVKALKDQGYEVIEIDPLPIDQVFNTTSKIFGSDSYREASSKIQDEGFDKAVAALNNLSKLPSLLHFIIYFILNNLMGEKILSNTFDILTNRSAGQLWQLHHQADLLFDKFNQQLNELSLDFIISPVHTHPTHEHEQFSKVVFGTGYSMVANLLNLPAGCIPVTKVIPDKDTIQLNDWLSNKFNNQFELGRLGLHAMYSQYDAIKMKDIPIGIQVIGRRYQDLKVVKGMQIVDKCLKEFKSKN